ncbi:MAG: HD domain-containing protein [Myxococcota bacterium]
MELHVSLPLDALRPTYDAHPSLFRLRDEARERLGQHGFDAGHDLAHADRVSLWTMRLLGDQGSAEEAVSAALLHDVVNLPKDHPERAMASVRSADVARALLPACGFRDASTTRVAEAIEDHSYSRGAVPRSALGCALQDADRLETLGAIGLMRVFSTGARLGARYFDPDDPWSERREPDDLRYSIDHFRTKLLRLEHTMQTPAGAKEARRRTARLEHFLADLADELGVTGPAWADGRLR